MRALLVVLMLLALPLTGFAGTAAPAVPGVVVTEAEQRRVISDFLTQKTEHLNAQVTVKKIGVVGDLKLPAGTVSYEVVAPERWEGWGNASLALIVRVDDQVKRNLTVLVEVEALAEMVVATRTLERGDLIAPGDVALARRDLAHLQGGRFCLELEQVVGLRVKNAMRANSPLRRDYLERVPIVKSGALITIVAENDAVRITASGRAKASGALGDSILVQNLASQKEFPARVVDATTVKVDF